MTLVKRSNRNYPSLPWFFDNFFGNDLTDWGSINFSSTETTLPAVNVKETVDAFEIEVAAPGMSKEDFKINIDNNMLIISSEKKEEKSEVEKGNYTRKEFSYQSFQRSFSIPEASVEGDKITAKYCSGILCITLPKREELKPKPMREIKIN